MGTTVRLARCRDRRNRVTGSLLVGLLALVASGAWPGQAAAEPAASDPSESGAAESTRSDGPAASAAKKRIDWSQLPERIDQPKQGYGYARLSQRQTRALRRRVHLPMAALSTARSPEELRKAMRVEPLPDPAEPFVPVGHAEGDAGDPFGGGKTASFRENPMKALGEFLGSVDGTAAASSREASSDVFGVSPAPIVGSDAASADDNPFGADSPSDSETESPADSEDPFDF